VIDNWTKFDKAFSIEDSQIFKTKSFKIDYIQEKGLSSTQLKKLRVEWIKILPKLDNVEYAYFGHKITQGFFDSICSMPNLKGLWIKWSQLDDFSKIGNLKSLNYLIVGGSTKIQTLNGLESLIYLKSLELSSFFGLKNISELTGLMNLERLELYGSLDGKRLQLENIDAVSDLINLRTLILDIKSKGVDINPVFGLKKLETLILPNSYFKNMTKKEILTKFPKLTKGLIDK
jgi:Leucine-rich repeat (LRR) protein